MTSITCHFWNAGQGLFSSGKIALPNNQEFVWVYDCGSSNQQNINAAIVNMKQTYPNEIIDLLAISHFDKDHINGLPALLTDRKVKQWLLPYYPLWQRLFIALSLNFQPNSDEFDFCINPVKFILDNYLESFTENSQIILVPSQQNPEEISRLEDKDNQPFSFQNNVDFENEFNEFKRPLVKSLNVYKPMVIEGVEFVPYNVSFANLAHKPNNITQFHQNIDAILTSSANTNSKKDQLQKLYDCNFQERNTISLFLYIKKITPHLINNQVTVFRKNTDFEYTTQHQSHSWGMLYNKSALLYTGDAELKTQSQLDELSRVLGKYRMIHIFAFQVPHHGSSYNNFKGLAKGISPNISIFSADPNHGTYKHPHAQVVRDFLPYTPILVDKNCGMFFTLN